MRLIFLFILLLNGLQEIFSQEIIGTLINAESGLADDNNSFVFKDSKGILWISSAQSINSITGEAISTYGSDKGVSGDYVQGSFVEDIEGNILSSTFENILKFSEKLNRFENFKITHDSLNYKEAYRILGFSDNKSALWISAELDILKLETSSKKVLQRIRLPKIFANATLIKNEKDEVNSIITYGWHYTPGISVIKLYNNDSILIKSDVGKIINDSKVNHVAYFSNELYISTTKNGIFKLNSELNLIEKLFDHNFGEIKDIKAIFDNYLLLATKKQGLLLYSIKNKSIEKILNTNNGLLSNHIINVSLIDNHLYVSHFKNGIQKIPIHHIINENHKVEKIKLSSTIRSIQILDGIPFIITVDSIYKATDKIKNVSSNTRNLNLLYKIDTTIIGFGTEYIELLSKNFNSYKNYKTNYIMHVSKEENDYNFYASGDTTIRRYLFSKNEILSKDLSKAHKIIDNRSPELYIPFNNGVLTKFSNDTLYYSKNDKIQKFYLENHIDNFSLSSDKKEVFFCTSSGLYIFSSKNGLIHFGKKIWEQYNTQVFNVINYNGDYIIVNKEGIYRFLKDEKRIYRYDVNINLNRTTNSGIARIKNKILIGSNKDLYIFNPDSIKIKNRAPTLLLSEFAINGIPSEDGRKFINEKNIKLDYNQNDISLKAIVVDNIKPTLSKIKYYINDVLYTMQSNQTIRANNLQTGTNKIKIIGIDSYHNKSEAYTLNITITPPFYLSWWFLLGFSGLLIAAGWYSNYIRTQKQLKAQQIEMDRREAVHTTRENIARDLHDEMGTELNKILFLSDEALYQKDEKEKAALLDKISLLAGDSIKSMRDILWVLNTENETLGKLVTRVRQNMFKNLKDHKIKLISTVPPNHDDVILNNDYMKNIHLICKEATNNIIKYAEADEVKLHITYEQGKLDIIINDNGKGFEGEKRSDAYGLDNMQKRAAAMGGTLDINSSKGEGVGLHLKLDI